MTNPYLQIFQRKKSVPSRMSSREWAAVAPEVRQGAFFSAGVEDAFLLDGLRGMVEKGIAEGWNESTFVSRMRQWMRETTDKATGKPYLRASERKEWTLEERVAYENSTRNIDSLARLKLIFRTQMDMAIGMSFWLSEMTPERLESHPAFRFVRRPGALTKRLDHVAHENDVRLKTDIEYWTARNAPELGGFGYPWPPYGYNSWMDIALVSRETCEALGLLSKDAPTPELSPEEREKWGLPAAVKRATEERSVKKLSPEQRDALQDFFEKRGINTRYDESTGKFVRLAAVEKALTVAETQSPEEFVRACGLDPKKDATTEEVSKLLNTLAERYPENGNRLREIVTSITTTERSAANKDAAILRIEETLKKLLRMCSPSALDRLPQISIAQKSLGFRANGTYDPSSHVIEYNLGASEESIYHEFIHALHFHGAKKTRDELRSYFAKRTKGSKYGPLAWNGKGKRDSWATSVDTQDDYAGTIYNYDWRITQKNGTIVREPDTKLYPLGSEMATRHLQRLALPPEKFVRYWNAKKNGKYLWRECFIKCLEILF